MTFEYNGLVWFQTIGLKETAVSDQSRFQANGGAVYNTPGLILVYPNPQKREADLKLSYRLWGMFESS